MPMQITAHAIGIAMHFALSGAEWAEAELSCLRFLFFFFAFWGDFFFWSRKKKCVGVPPPPPPPPLNLLPFFWGGGPLCLFLDGLGAFLLSQRALRSLKCPFWKWPCPSKSLIRALWLWYNFFQEHKAGIKIITTKHFSSYSYDFYGFIKQVKNLHFAIHL